MPGESPEPAASGGEAATHRHGDALAHRGGRIYAQAVGLERIRLVAHDLGALTAVHLAYAQPERLRAMAVLSVPPPFMRMSTAMLPAMRHIPPLLFPRRGRSIAHVFEPPYVATPMPPETIQAHLAPQQRPEMDAATNGIVRTQCGDTSRYADHVEFAEVPGAAHFVTDDNPAVAPELLRDFFERMG
jgi:pimeloyl-ACP methyl ester carboxylesterase